MSDIRCLEHHTLKVPYEILNKKFRSAQKVLDKEVSQVQSAITDLENVIKTNPHQIPGLLNQLEDKLVQLAAKSDDSANEEVRAAECCKRRVQHLAIGCNGVNQNQLNGWKRTRLDRMLVEHFLRSGKYESAIALAKTADIEDLTNINLFLVAKDVEESLIMKDISKCLAWCQDNKSKLRKMKSSLEFNVRLQEFIELIKSDRRIEAVHHARKYLAIEDADQLQKVQKACALLAFPVGETPVAKYKEMFEDVKWKELVEQFRRENYRLYQLSNQSVFTVALQAGLSALKTPHCYRPFGDRNYECPVCQTPLNELASPLPFAHCSQSRLICASSGKPMNENNHPMMLPNGYVYGEKALEKMAADNDNGDVKCPRTKEVFHISTAQKVYIM